MVMSSTTLGASRESTRGRFWLQAAEITGFALLLGLAAQIRIPLPFTPVPLTLQVFVLLLAAYRLGSSGGAASAGLYVGLGLAGLPMFSGGAAGWATLTGFTGGYLMAFPLAAAVAGLVARPGAGKALRITAGFAAVALIHTGGALWLALFVPVAPSSATGLLTWSLLPFLGTDVVKVLLAERLSRPRQPH